MAVGGLPGAGGTPDIAGAGSLGPSGGTGGSPPTLLLALVLCAFAVGGGFPIIVARRRRPKAEEQSLEAAVVATPVPAVAPARSGPANPMPDPAIEDGEIPRWRRPSLRAARSASDRGPTAPSYQLAFNAAAVAGTERRLVRYRVVRMMDGPDEIRSQEVGQLEENDELEVLGRYAGYIHVRTPVGTEGWVHRTTLGPPIGSEEPSAEAGPPEFDLEAAFDLQRARTSRPAPKAAPAQAAAPAPVIAPPAEAPARKTPARRRRKAEPSV